MLKKKCSSCSKKIERKFKFCPWCGTPTKKVKQEDYGMLGLNDEVLSEETVNPLSLFGGSLGNIFNQLTKQLSKELQNMDMADSTKPRGIEIRFSTGKPVQRVMKQGISNTTSVEEIPIDSAELERRKKLPLVVAVSNVRRLPEGIIYEIDTPGVKSKQDVSILRMENGIELRAFSADKCYIKTIPLKVDIVKYVVRDDKVIIQIKN